MNVTFTLILDNQSGTDLKLTDQSAFSSFVTGPPQTLAAHSRASVVTESPAAYQTTFVSIGYEVPGGGLSAWATGNEGQAGVPTSITAFMAGATSLQASGAMDASSNPYSATVTITD